MKAIRVLFKWIDRITAWLAVIALVVMFGLVFLNVIMRYIFGSGFAWSEEGARYALMAVIILGVLGSDPLPGPLLRGFADQRGSQAGSADHAGH